MYFPSLVVFALSNVIHYQPWNLDNTKVFYNAWVPVAVAAVSHFLAVLREGKHRIGAFLVAALFALSCASSAFALWQAVRLPALVWDEPEPYVIADWAIANTAPRSVWLTDTRHNHPIPTLAGRQVVLGYRGWIGSHNLDESERLRAIGALAKDPDATELIDEFDVEWLCLCSDDSQEVTFKVEESSVKWKLEYRSERCEVWKRFDRWDGDTGNADWFD
jgi:hypothetical protein